MKWIGFLAGISGLLSPATDARAQPLGPQVGDTYEVTLNRDSSREGSDGSSGSSHDDDRIVERVVGVRDDGLELEYDLPDASAEERARNWQFPVRVFKPRDGPLQLLNRPDLEARVEVWLKAAKWTRAACGHWIFTWNAFRIECDPQSVIETLESFDLRSPALGEGAPYRDTEARGPAPMAREKAGPDGETFVVEMEIDAEAVRRGRAESDVILGEIMNKPVTLEAALRERRKEAVSGTISVTLETDSGGNARRRTKLTKLDIRTPDGRSETETVKEVVERRLVSGAAAPNALPNP